MNKPRVIVLMATFNGLDWLPEQLNSILNQVDVDISVIISDDKSPDASCEFIKKMVGSDNRITLLSRAQKFGSRVGEKIYDARFAVCDNAVHRTVCPLVKPKGKSRDGRLRVILADPV